MFTASQLYEKIHLGNPGDSNFYLRVTRDAENVLELGCGWGRLCLPISRQGSIVVGLDHDPELLMRARKNVGDASNSSKLTYLEADIRDFSLLKEDGSVQQFDRIILAYNTLYALGGASEVKKCLACLSRHLTRDGELWFDVYPMDDFHASCMHSEPEEDDGLPITTLTEDGMSIDVYEQTEIDWKSQKLDVTYSARQSGVTTSELKMTHHYLLTSQITALLSDAGLNVIADYEGFEDEQEQESEESEQLIFGAERIDQSERGREDV